MQGQRRVSARSQGIDSHAGLRRRWHRYPQVHFPSQCVHPRNTLLLESKYICVADTEQRMYVQILLSSEAVHCW